MHGPEKSDRLVVPRKSSNKAQRSAAERMEGRHLVEAWVHQPQTAQRYHPGQEPGAGKPHAGICAGDWW
jgi:hypothetical protein